MMPLLQDLPPFRSYIRRRRAAPAMCCRCSVCVLDQMTAHYVNGDSCDSEHFLLIFQPKWAAMYP
jgi:hypothetical protein